MRLLTYPPLRAFSGLVQALEEHIHRQVMMTSRMVDERNSILGLATPFEPEGRCVRGDQAIAPTYASYPNAKSESRARSSLPPPSRLAKTRDTQGCSMPPHAGAAGKSGEDMGHRNAADVARCGGPVDVMALQQSEINPPLKTWGSTGRRQPSRPRQKA